MSIVRRVPHDERGATAIDYGLIAADVADAGGCEGRREGRRGASGGDLPDGPR